MSMKSVKNKVHKNGFDLSSRIGFTAKVGEILPVQWKFVYPGEKFKFNQASFTRTSPVNSAAYSRIRESYDTFFVPLRLLWDKFPQWIIQTGQPQFAASLTSGAVSSGTMPYLTDVDLCNYLQSLIDQKSSTARGDINRLNRAQQFYKLMDCLGYSSVLAPYISQGDVEGRIISCNSPDRPTALNILPLLCYQKIYSDYFRYQQWEKSKPYTFNLDFILSESQNHLDISVYDTEADFTEYNDTIFELHYANFPKDYFTGQLPSAQFGDVAIAGPVLGDIAFIGSSNSPSQSNALLGNAEGTRRSDSPSNAWRQRAVTSASGNPNTSGISVLAIRQAQALQKWKEITQAAGFDYRSQMKAHWNVEVGNVQSDKCQRIGGFDSNINISEVVNQALTADDPANIAGKGVGSNGSSFTFENNSNEYGFLMTVYHAVPILEYTSDSFVERELLKVNPSDFAIPEFDSIGMQETYLSELCSRNSNGLDLTLVGYAPRYAEYKTARDVVRGGFLYGYKEWTSPLDRVSLAGRIYLNAASGLSWRSFKVNPSQMNSIFLAQVNPVADGDYVQRNFDDDQLIINFMNSCHAVRNFSRDGLPY